MIAFITDDWMLDLTNQNIQFVEENSLFYDNFIGNYSLPFSIKVSDEFAVKLGFITENNIKNHKKRFDGILQQDGVFYKATLRLSGFDGKRLSGSFVYGSDNIPLLDTKLSDLPWPVITTSGMVSHAKEVVRKGYPEVGYNFPMIIDKEFDEKLFR